MFVVYLRSLYPCIHWSIDLLNLLHGWTSSAAPVGSFFTLTNAVGDSGGVLERMACLGSTEGLTCLFWVGNWSGLLFLRLFSLFGFLRLLQGLGVQRSRGGGHLHSGFGPGRLRARRLAKDMMNSDLKKNTKLQTQFWHSRASGAVATLATSASSDPAASGGAIQCVASFLTSADQDFRRP